jgi:DNA helicase-2/ATP-dependent DNA helicase PcrA
MFDTTTHPLSPVAESPPYLEHLNDDQRAAATHGEGPVLIIAGAGTGKTRTLAARVAHLIETGTPADRILLLTFTRRAASEMLRRVSGSLDGVDATAVWGGTFHAMGHRLLRAYGAAVGLDEAFTVLDRSDTESLFGMVRSDLGFGKSRTRFPRKETVASIYSRVVNAQEPLTEVLERRYPWCAGHAEAIGSIFTEYTNRKRTANVIDYDDLLVYWRALMASPAGPSVRASFDHVLVDEYQDTNQIQADILVDLSAVDGNLTVVGDDAQSIYSFRAARVENILGFPDRHPEARVYRLERNYRSTPEILSVTNAVIAASDMAFDKHLWTERPAGPTPEVVTCFDEAAQAEWVCDRVLEMRERGIALHEQAVLFRTGHHSSGLELELGRRQIPFVKFGGLTFMESAHVKDLLAMLRVVENPMDELAWHRVLLLLPGVGPATATKVMVHLSEVAASDGDLDLLEAFLRYDVPVGLETREVIGLLRDGLRAARGSDTAPVPSDQIDALRPYCDAVFPIVYDDAQARLADIDHLASLATDYPDRSRFLTEITLDPPASSSGYADAPVLDDDYLVLSTIHSAKGGEWRSVTLIHAADGNIPSDMALVEPGGVEEERRLMYVALTRARDHLAVTVPQRFYHHRRSSNGAHTYALPSRFLDGVGDLVLSTAFGAPAVPSGAAWSGDAIDVSSELRSLWE